MKNSSYPENRDWEPSARVASIIGYKWSIPIIFTLSENDEMGFSELQQSLGVSAVMLADTLDILMDSSIVTKRSSGVRTFYRLKIDARDMINELERFNRKL